MGRMIDTNIRAYVGVTLGGGAGGQITPIVFLSKNIFF